jgi:prepilin-type N-terminal cleavage/methylation domain-containing protein
MNLNKLKKNKAFTLIELMVATTIFTIIMLMGVGSLVSTSNAAKYSQRLRIAVDNVNFAMESMTREIRMGTNYYCGSSYTMSPDDKSVNDCTEEGIVAFVPQQIVSSPGRIGYFRKLRSDGSNTYTLIRCVETGSNCISVVADNINVTELKFSVKGSGINDFIQPSVIISMKGVVNVGVGTPFYLRSMASQRSAEK